ncbi:MAG: Na/Pi symporter [Chitinophagaceae bacterium]|nr:Na/Pi cotransporter family protein [Chitinophagaceae bacterium]
MNLSYDIWEMLTGIVIFLLGANFLEEGVRFLAGRPFKLFLKKQTSNKLKAIGSGAIVTSVLQSSSVVNLMVLAFVGAGIIQMENALGIMLGTNLGTTVSNWLVATLGFNFNIEMIAYPITAIAGMTMLLSNKEGRLNHWSRLLFGFAFLFVGLTFIKSGMQDLIKETDFAQLNEQPAIIFLLIGLLITTLVQSSSATVAIVLSALYVDAISLLSATAIVLGAEIGTTLKLILAAAKGSAVKKRVALGNVLFNTINVLLLFIVLGPVNRLITDVIGIKDNLIALVLFQTLLNVVGIILFYPLLRPFGRFLEKRFISDEDETLFIHKVKVTDTDPAIAALEKETAYLLYHTAAFALEAFNKKVTFPDQVKITRSFASKKLMEKYDYIKHQHGEIYNYIAALQRQVNDKEITIRLLQLIDAARNTMYAAKNIKDAWPDIEQLSKSSKDQKYNYYLLTGERVTSFFEKIIPLVFEIKTKNLFEKITVIYKFIQENYKQMLAELHREDLHKNLTELEFSTIINFNREIFTCEKSVAFAVKGLLLTGEEAAHFDELPGFIR